MHVGNKEYRTVWMKGRTVYMIEQNLLPFRFKIFKAKTHLDTAHAIKTMIIRGAGAIGAAAGYAMAQAFLEAEGATFWEYIETARKTIESTRPTAQNLFYAVERVYAAGKKSVKAAVAEAEAVADEDAFASQQIGKYGNTLIKDGFRIETHCNAGWLAFVDYGTALSPIYMAHKEGKKIFVYVDETRPRSQGARLTAWELKNEEVPHVIVPDNAGAHLMSKGLVDMMITGADRIALNGDTANKIGTFEKAIVAKEFGIPFYIAAPTSTFDAACPSGKNIVIEERSMDEVNYAEGPDAKGVLRKIRLSSPGSDALNPAFDVTPAKYITGIITENGIVSPDENSIKKLLGL